MGNLTPATLLLLLLVYLPTELLCIQVNVPESERSTMLFASVTLRCEFTTSANPQDVLVTWRFKSFCKDPILEYYSTSYQAALQLGQDPANDCQDRQRTVRTVVQKRGLNEPMLGVDYRNRKITVQNMADLVITEVMWWDNGVYFCNIDAAGDTSGDSDREIKLIVYHWLTVLLIILGALVLIMLLAICWCQCCPQKCCCYVRCPCCPQTCCCPEKAVMQHRMMREAKRAMAPWMHGQPIYAPISSNNSIQGVPMLYSGSFSDPGKQNFAMAPIQMIPQQTAPQHHLNGSAKANHQNNRHVLDYLENQVRGLDVPMHPIQNGSPVVVQPQPPPAVVPYTPGPPSMLSALDEMGVRGTERRVVTLPPIIQRAPSFSSRRGPRNGEPDRGAPRFPSHSSSSTNPSGRGVQRRYRDHSPPRRGALRNYSDDSDREGRQGRGYRREPSPSRSRPRTRSRDDLMEEMRSRSARRERSYSPPRRKGSWSSDEEDSDRRRARGRDWPEKPPSYSSVESQHGTVNDRRNHSRLSDRSSRSITSMVI
ncbi:immunoglobulin-like domain-containing receptor 1 [Corythoichthys intestinalis]|uniref:immunoglobulin-like domain-containing receptor 1 n=1 Tax=Corythoichthys intestinalis TaxID=161448 RepID=UPI0025A58866|nr:immunoglobulin-like domain-containing receptor 1 [Corythoichthys intestinalis]XP_061799615.1 immunoglobulin-like domain-containing receptor 1 [Nerophis lumbriciformis]